MKTNYLLIDYENVQPSDMTRLNQANIRIVIFTGANQSKIPLEMAEAIQPMGDRVAYVRNLESGANALDFYLAYYLGEYITHDPTACFHVISNDTGFDPLIRHLKAKHIHISRIGDLSKLPFLKASTPASIAPDVPDSASATPEPKPAPTPRMIPSTLAERTELVIQDLRKRGKSKPGKLATLSTTINALFQKKLSDDEIRGLVKALQKQKVIQLNGEKISYNLP